jgi:transcriptional regulator with XRE-family HTH domain
MLENVGSRETRAARGLARGRGLTASLVSELVEARRTAGVSQRTVANLLGWSQSELSRMERLVGIESVSLVDVAGYAAVLGLELSAGLHPAGEPLRDKGHQAVLRRLIAIFHESWTVAREVLLPNPGDPRAWDVVLRIVGCIVGIEVETRVRDVQALTRRVRARQRDGDTDVVVLVLAQTAHNRRVLPELLEALGPEFATSPRAVLKALREGRPIPGSAVILL